jgi:hypothetical protein
MGERNLIYGWLQTDTRFADLAQPTHSNGIGLVTLAVCAYGLWVARERRAIRLLALSTASLAVLFTAYGDFALWRHLQSVLPGAAGIRAVGRIGMVLALPAAIGVALGFDRVRERRHGLFAALLAVACAAEQAHQTRFVDKAAVRAAIASLAARVEPRCGSFFLAASGPAGYAFENDDAAWVQLATGTPTVNGRYGNAPPRWGFSRYQVGGGKPSREMLQRAFDRWVTDTGLDRASVCWIDYEAPSGLPTVLQAFGVPYRAG